MEGPVSTILCSHDRPYDACPLCGSPKPAPRNVEEMLSKAAADHAATDPKKCQSTRHLKNTTNEAGRVVAVFIHCSRRLKHNGRHRSKVDGETYFWRGK
jgi:hypothetical protein